MKRTPARVKAVLQTMIDGIRVDARDQIEPTFRVPAVRIDYGLHGASRARTGDLLHAMQALSQLSYSPESLNPIVRRTGAGGPVALV
jgi:hypothetical protein